jgi:hypothetical protein
MDANFERQSPFDKLIEQRKAEGWSYIGISQLLETKFVDGKFVEVPVRTKEEAVAQQVENLKNIVRKSGEEKDVTVELVDASGDVYNGIETPNKYQAFYIFAKIK